MWWSIANDPEGRRVANSDRQNARIEHDKDPAHVMTAVLKDDTELFKQFMDNESFRRWLTNTACGLTYESSVAEA